MKRSRGISEVRGVRLAVVSSVSEARGVSEERGFRKVKGELHLNT